jgi:endo-1,4-beta-xylanase
MKQASADEGQPRERVLSRRQVIAGTGGLLGAAAIAGLMLDRAGADPHPLPQYHFELAPALRSYTSTSGIRYGCAGAAPSVQPDRILLEEFAIEANLFSPEGALKWDQTEPQPGAFDFSQGDSIVAFATRNNMLVNGHTLVWYAAIPPWVSRLTTAPDARLALERHIETEVSRYRGKIWEWDVVNEAIEPNDRLEDDYRNSVWFRCLGHDYVDLSFRLARAADATTPLALSEYGIEYASADCRRRRRALLTLLQKLRDRHTPVDCLALQSHLAGDQTFDRDGLTSFLREVVKLGYRLLVTELDVNDAKIRGSQEERDAAVARHLTEYLDILFSVARPLSITTWGLSDRYTWLRQYNKRADGSPLRPLPLDADFNRKPMWAVLAKYMAR